jgi:hypothetical protein
MVLTTLSLGPLCGRQQDGRPRPFHIAALDLFVATADVRTATGAASGPVPPPATDSPPFSSDEETPAVTEVAVRAPGGLRFEPNLLEARAGAQLEIALQNLDQQDHTFAVDELNVLMLAAAGQTVRATVSIHRPNAGRFSFSCSIPGHRERGDGGHHRGPSLMEDAPRSVDGGTSLGHIGLP